MKRFLRIAEKMTLVFPDWMTGNSDVMRQKFYRKYGADLHDHLINHRKTSIMAAYLIIAAIFLLLLILQTAGQFTGNDPLKSIARPGFGEQVRNVPVEVHVNYRNVEMISKINLKVQQRELTKEEKVKRLEAYGKKLKKIMLGENQDLFEINKPLNLIRQDRDQGISIHWTSSRPDLIDESGELDLTQVSGSEEVILTANMSYEDVSEAVDYTVTISGKNAEKEDILASISGRLNDELKKITAISYSQKLDLPEDLGNGIEVRWFEARETNKSILFPILLISLLVVYFKRYDKINKEIKEAEDSLLTDLPEFINKLVLLLNAGLVVSTAFEKITGDYNKMHKEPMSGRRKERYLYEQLLAIQSRVDRSNTPLILELKAFSQRCGVREMVRLTAVIADNWNKGSALAEKLESESELLWVSRKKKAEEKGKIAETKLIFPMVILLMVLIMIVIAPAMMEM
jgi:hypothetical protein